MFAIAADLLRDAVSVTYYPTFEAREYAFGASVGRLVPSRLAGPEHFWAELSEISRRRLDAGRSAKVAFITSNPKDCLAFATPHQVLTAACLRAGIAADDIASVAAQTATAFRLRANRHQPLRTLSGGESVKLAMAKAAIAVKNSDRLSVASPFSWLSAANAGLLTELLGRYTHRHLPVSVFAMEEEDAPDPYPGIEASLAAYPTVSFDLCLQAASVYLSTAVAIATREPARVDFSDAAFTLPSPCFLMGDNGQGKSLLAKLLAGAIVGNGRIHVAGGDNASRPRMIFQDVVSQMLSRSAAGMLAGLPPGVRAAIEARYRDLADACREHLDNCGVTREVAVDAAVTPSLLDIKLSLAARRLTADTSLVILDEPDWGLSRCAAAAYVLAVVGAAHRSGIPVLIISHKPWWATLARSRLTVTKEMTGGNGAGDNRDGFFVRLTKEM